MKKKIFACVLALSLTVGFAFTVFGNPGVGGGIVIPPPNVVRPIPMAVLLDVV